jgi:hypothetical protein
VLNVYNALGQVVATLIDEMQDAGYKTVEVSASNFGSGECWSSSPAHLTASLRRFAARSLNPGFHFPIFSL